MVTKMNGAGHDTLAALRAAKAEGYTLFPVWREMLADCETPVSAYRKLARTPYTFLLESVEGGERLARYSFVGVAPERVLRVRGNVAEWRYLAGERVGQHEQVACDDPLALVEAEMARDRVAPAAMPGLPASSLPRFTGGGGGLPRLRDGRTLRARARARARPPGAARCHPDLH